MPASFAFSIRQILHDLRTGMLFRPGLITAAYGALGFAAVTLERRFPPSPGGLRHAWMAGADPAATQVVLGTIAGSMMTIISIVYSLLVMALSLASMQFSPRILSSFISDRVSQTTLGVFVGTFTYSLVVLRAVVPAPDVFVPAVAVSGSIALALFALAWLLYFIHHIARGIHVNRIADRIAKETLELLDHEVPEPLPPKEIPHGKPASPPTGAAVVPAPASGYIQLVDIDYLSQIARSNKITLYMRRAVGEFTVEGNALLYATPADRVTEAVRAACTDAFDIGDVRTMQQDAEFGVRQIVDMALKAISPAVNDPSTAATCIDHLGSILCRLARRRCPDPEVRDPATGNLLLVRRVISFQRILDLAFNQIRQYGRNDMAVTLRVVRALGEVAEATHLRPHLARVLHHADLLEAGLSRDFAAADRVELAARLSALRETCRRGPEADEPVVASN